MPSLFVLLPIYLRRLGSHEHFATYSYIRKGSPQGSGAIGAKPPREDTAARQHRNLLSMAPALRTSSLVDQAHFSLANGICFLQTPPSISCLHGCVCLSLICHKYSPTILSLAYRILIQNTLSHVKHETGIEEPSWLPRTRRLTVKGCRWKTLESWLSWLVCRPEARV